MPARSVVVALALAVAPAAAARAGDDEKRASVFLHAIDVVADPGATLPQARVVVELVPASASKKSVLAERKLALPGAARVAVDAGADVRGRDAPLPAHRASSFLIDASAPVIVDLARRARGPGAPSPAALAGLLRDVVHAHITKKSYARGYDAASIVATRREGDCSEHAVLLAALARASDLPARVVHGVVVLEAKGQGGARIGAWGHAWTEVWTGDAWLLLDATEIAREAHAVYVPLSVLGAEGPGYATSMLTALGAHDVVRVRVESALLHVTETRSASPGETVVELSGGPLQAPIQVPLWVTFDDAEVASGRACESFNDVFVLQLPDDRLYVHQYNSICGERPVCRVLDPATRVFRVPKHECLRPLSLGTHLRAKTIGGGWISVVSDSEGVAEQRFMEWDPDRGVGRHVDLSLGQFGVADGRVEAGALIVETNCDLARGGCDALTAAEMGRPKQAFRWRPGAGWTRLE